MEIQLYQFRKDGYSEYVIICPTCSQLFTIHETYLGNTTHSSNICDVCNYHLQSANNNESLVLFVCNSLKVDTETSYIPKNIDTLYKAYKNTDVNYELNVYKNAVIYRESEQLK